MKVVRLDRWLWSVRSFKTRTLATDACKRNWVTVNGMKAKPSKEIRVGDLITIKKGQLEMEVRVLDLLDKRVSASKVAQFLEDLTPSESYLKAKEKLSKIKVGNMLYPIKGRPSKKNRRDLEEFLFGCDEE